MLLLTTINKLSSDALTNRATRWVALMIQLDVRVRTSRAQKFVGGVGWLTPTTYIQLAGAGSMKEKVEF